MINRLLYFGYYLKQLNWHLFHTFQIFVKQKTGKSVFLQWLSIFFSSLKYNISILEYFQFKFYEKSHEERLKWAGTGYMYEYQLKMNPKDQRHILDDKTLFYKNYQDFFVHAVADIADLEQKLELAERLLESPSGKLVFKVADGKCGRGVAVKSAKDFTKETMIAYMRQEDFDLVEEYIIQHESLMRLSPSAVNTVRIFTQLDKNNEVEILGCRQRIAVNSAVDNLAAGNLAAPIDEKTGIINGSAIYSDITKSDTAVHPVTGVAITGFQVPFWKETIEMVKTAAKLHPQNRSIGWDVVITDKGPGLIEGNHDWCKLLWQLPVKQGLKHMLEKHKQ